MERNYDNDKSINDINSCMFDDWIDIDSIQNDCDKSDDKGPNLNTSTNSNTTSNLNISALCCDEELIGFDKNTGSSWIYPTNYTVRDYQYNIVKAALFKNTLVSLPTGLGKTFIAAVVMFNYYRWYPLGKIIFTAPTRPLVAQQIEACYNITAIPPEHTIEMTGSMQTAARKIAWKQKRVFFATPQVVQNDLESGSCPGELVRCLVIDEAHRARGRHSYCQVIETLALQNHRLFRVLALSATPGSKVDDVIHVVRNLQISHLELRTERCIDVAMYRHSRSIQTIVVPLGEELTNIRDQYIQILDVYTRRLVQHKVLVGNIGGLSKGKIIMLFKEFQNRERSLRHPQHQYLMHDFTMVITLYHGLELLIKHGARVFLNFFDERSEKEWVGKDTHLLSFLERLREDLGTNPFSLNTSVLPDGTFPEITEELQYGHPKFDHLRTTIMDHFTQAKTKGQATKAIVFCEYRESVNLVHCLLLQCRPMIKPYMFVGQGQGSSSGGKHNTKPFTQKQQLRVMKLFREGACNVLVSTCVGEEGLDVGNVDLIICFDISNSSPIRLVQRCGRTGRERGGRVVILVTEGREHQTLRDCIIQRDSLNKRVLQSKELVKNLFQACPRMFPNSVTPVCQKMFITVEQKKVVEKPPKGQGKIRDMLVRKSSFDNNFQLNHNGSSSSSHILSNSEYLAMYPEGMPDFKFFESVSESWNISKDLFSKNTDAITETEPKSLTALSEWTEWQRKLQYTVKIGHSRDSEIFSELLQFADKKRFSVTSDTQNPTSLSSLQITTKIPILRPTFRPSPTKKKGKSSHQNQMKQKNFDIRELFMKQTQLNNKEETEFKAKLKETLEDCGIHNDDKETLDAILERDHLPSGLINLMVELNIQKCNEIETTPSKYQLNLNIEDLVNCDSYIKEKNKIASMLLSNWDATKKFSFDKISFEDIDLENFLTPNNPSILKELDLIIPTESVLSSFGIEKSDIDYLGKDDENTPKVSNSQVIENQNYEIDLGDIDDIFAESSMSGNEVFPIINGCSASSPNKAQIEMPYNCIVGDKKLKSLTSSVPQNEGKEYNSVNIDDLFNESPMPMPVEKVSHISKKDELLRSAMLNVNVNNLHSVSSKSSNALDFFGLKSVDDIFDNDDSMDVFSETCESQKKITNILPEKTGKNMPKSPSKSPILCSQKSSNQSYLKLVNGYVDRQTCSTPIHLKSDHNKKNFNGIMNDTVNLGKTLNQHDITDVFEESYDQDMSKLGNNIDNNELTCIPHNKSRKKEDSSFLSVTQIINLIDRDCVRDDKDTNTSDVLKEKDKSIVLDDSDGSSKSIILSSQVVKQKSTKRNDTLRKKLSITILETSDSSNGDEDIFISTKLNSSDWNSNRCITSPLKIIQTECKNGLGAKRKLSPVSSNEYSPFFNKIPKFDHVQNSKISPKNKLSLKDKLNFRKNTSPLKVLNTRQDTDGSSSRFSFGQNRPESEIDLNSSTQSIISHLQSFSKSSSPGWLCKKNVENKNNNLTSSMKYAKEISSESDTDSDFADKSFTKKHRVNKSLSSKVRVKKKRKKKPVSEFIDYEAILSDDSYEKTSGECDNSQNSTEQDASMIEFLCDEEHIEADENVDMQAKYLQSVKSPIKAAGKFKIPQLLPKFTADIFSQVDPDENQSYELDSFCIDANEGLTQRHDMSELEIAEAILKKRKARRKPKRMKVFSPPKKIVSVNPADDSPIRMKKKRRPNLHIDSESSTDDDIFS